VPVSRNTSYPDVPAACDSSFRAIARPTPLARARCFEVGVREECSTITLVLQTRSMPATAQRRACNAPALEAGSRANSALLITTTTVTQST
jgi:predicted alternative tryptophan synthase beta-subunit